MAINLFEPRKLLGVWEQTKQAKKFLQSFLFGRVFQSVTEHIDLDEVTRKRIMAPFVALDGVGKVIGRSGFKSNTYTPPKLAPKSVLREGDLQTRLAGESLYDGMTPDQRAVALVQKDLMDFDDMITRRIEWMCRELLFTGQIHMEGDDYDETISFGHTLTETLTSGALWSASTATPLDDIAGWALAVAAESGVMPTTCIMATDTLKAFTSHPSVLEATDKTLSALLAVNPRDIPQGGRHVGTYNIPECGNIDVVTYPEWFEIGTTRYPMIPAGQLALVNPDDSFLTAYGAYTDMSTDPAVTYAVSRYPRSWYEAGPNLRFIEMVSRPLPVAARTNSWYRATVL